MEQLCKLYRNLYELIHPSISRENITKYSIILNEDILPIRVFYPGIEVDLQRIILYVPGECRKISFYQELAKQSNSIVLLFDYVNNNQKEVYEKTIRYITDELVDNFNLEDLFIMTDGIGCEFVYEMSELKSLKVVYLNPLFDIDKNRKHSIIITNSDENQSDVNYSFKGDFSRISEDDGLAMREMIFSIVRDFIFSKD